jgi:glycosyltransferase involved in cell wall biosynthesis
MTLPHRILFVTECFGVGGTENHLLDLLPALKDKGFEVAAFCFTERGSRAQRLEGAGIEVSAAPELGPRKRSLLAPLRVVGGAAKLFGLIRRFHPTIVHFYLPGPYLAGAPVAIAAGVPIKLMSRRSLNDYQRNWPGAGAFEHILHTRMDALLGNAHAVTQELIGEGCPEAKAQLIYNGVQLPDAPPNRTEARETLGLDTQAFVATMVANLLPYKGHLDLIAALAEIADRLPRPWVVLCAGRDGGSHAEIERAILQANLSSHIRLLGARNDVPHLLAASDLGILAPTRNEGFSNAVLESMAAGLPMVVTNVGGNAEAILDGETGLVVPPHEPSALGGAILKLAEAPQLRRAMGERARKRVADKFSLAASVDKYCALYEDLLNEHGAISL